jgi:hypothetical protein
MNSSAERGFWIVVVCRVRDSEFDSHRPYQIFCFLVLFFLLSNCQKRVYHEFRFMLFTFTTRYANPANQPAGQGTHAIMGSG